MCDRPFTDDDIVREVSYVDNATGRLVSAPLTHFRLREKAVPSKFLDCTSYFSTICTRREDPESKRQRLDTSAMQTAFAALMGTFRKEEEADRILSVNDQAMYARSKLSAFFHAIKGNESLTLVHIVEGEAPWIQYLIVLYADLTLTFCIVKTPVKRLGLNLHVSAVVKSKKNVMELFEDIEK